MTSSKQLFLTFIVSVTLLLLVAAIFAPPVSASTIDAQDLPPRPEPTATPQATAVPGSPFVGGTIQLSLVDETIPTAGLWTAVQWQDANSDWHTVEGWQGTFDPSGMVTWWVAPRDLGTGPFRWQLFSAEDGDLLGVSDGFYLPEPTGQVVEVEVSSPVTD